jgi:hypothetical protein
MTILAFCGFPSKEMPQIDDERNNAVRSYNKQKGKSACFFNDFKGDDCDVDPSYTTI